VFDTEIMRPIGASDDWSWIGYDNSWVDLDGTRVNRSPAAVIGEAGFRSTAWTSCASVNCC